MQRLSQFVLPLFLVIATISCGGGDSDQVGNEIVADIEDNSEEQSVAEIEQFLQTRHRKVAAIEHATLKNPFLQAASSSPTPKAPSRVVKRTSIRENRPVYRLEGFIRVAGESRARIAGKFYVKGDRVADWILLELESDRILVDRDGRTYTVLLGETLSGHSRPNRPSRDENRPKPEVAQERIDS